MEFIKNIHGKFILHSYDFFKENYHNLDLKNFIYPEIIVSVHELNIEDGIYFKVEEFPDVKGAVEKVIEHLEVNFRKDAKNLKRILKKILDAWDVNPENFVLVKGTERSPRYSCKTKKPLTEDEYMPSLAVYFDNFKIHNQFHIGGGYGTRTYYPKETYQKYFEEIDDWCDKEMKNFKSSKVKTRLKNYINKKVFNLEFDEVPNYIRCIHTSKEEIEIVKPEFPIAFSPNGINWLLDEIDDPSIVDDELIEEVKAEYDIDLSKIKDWEIETSHEGFHDHDGQMCEYTATFTSPNGHEYYLFHDHSLMSGWELYVENDGDTIKPE